MAEVDRTSAALLAVDEGNTAAEADGHMSAARAVAAVTVRTANTDTVTGALLHEARAADRETVVHEGTVEPTLADWLTPLYM